MMKRLFLSTLLLSSLVGCESTNLDTRWYRTYQDYLTKAHYRAFAVTAGTTTKRASAYGRSWDHGTMEVAIERAIEGCEKGEKKYDNIGKCRLHSIGDIKVFGMSEEQLDKAIEYYGSNIFATNEDFAMPELALPIAHDPVFSDLKISDTKRSVGTYEGYPKWRPGPDKNSFTIGEENFAFFYIKISNTNPGQTHSWYWKFYTPDKKLYWDSEKRTKKIGPSWNFYHTLFLDTPLVQAGQWKVEFEYDERVVEERTFEILEAGG